MEPTATTIENVSRALKKLRSRPVSWRPVNAGGFTPARRWIVTLEDGRTAFVKVASDEMTASWLRDEHVVYSVLRGASFMPRYLGFFDDGSMPVLALEDLSAARWPPPWDRGGIDAVLASLAHVATTNPPDGTPLAVDDALEIGGGWDQIARDPAPFLGLGLCSGAWLERNLAELRAAAADAPFGGDAYLHFDVRSDNICIRGEAAELVDWNLTSVGNRQLDVVFWLPSLQAEGGPAPEEVLPDADPRLVAACAAYFCSRAARAPLPSAPRVREVQLVQARTALPWAARALRLAGMTP